MHPQHTTPSESVIAVHHPLLGPSLVSIRLPSVLDLREQTYFAIAVTADPALVFKYVYLPLYSAIALSEPYVA
jgi:hypothetical protein